MADIVTRLRAAIHFESAHLSPRTSPLIETARDAISEINQLRADVAKLRRACLNELTEEAERLGLYK